MEDEKILERLRADETRVSNTLRALDALKRTSEYQEVKALVFDGLVAQLENNLKSEAKKAKVDVDVLYRIQGQLEIAKKFANIDTFIGTLKTQLEGIKKTQNG